MLEVLAVRRANKIELAVKLVGALEEELASDSFTFEIRPRVNLLLELCDHLRCSINAYTIAMSIDQDEPIKRSGVPRMWPTFSASDSASNPVPQPKSRRDVSGPSFIR